MTVKLEQMKMRIILVAIMTAAVSVSACQNHLLTPVRSIILGTPPLESSALIYVAEEQGLFAQNGLQMILKEYATGAAALDGLVNNEVDLAVPAEYALVGKAFQQQRVRALASIDKVQYFFLIGRQDRHITQVSDLRGKKIGVVQKTIAEFYLGRFLQLQGLNAGQTTLVNINIAQSENAIVNGDVDAIVSRPPYVAAIKRALGEKALVLPVQSDQALYALVIARSDWVTAQPDTIHRLLRAFMQAEDYLIHHPTEAKAIVQKYLNVDAAYVAAVWSENEFELSLDQSLILAMEDEARWMIRNKLTDEKQVPNFLDYVYVDGLEAIKPDSVNIIH